MADDAAEPDPLCQRSVPQTPEPFVWTEDAHCLYLSFLEDAFVNDLYHHHFCALDICGVSPPFPHLTAPPSMAAGSLSSTPSQLYSCTEVKSGGKRPRNGGELRSAKRKGKWLSHERGLENQPAFKPSIGPKDSFPFLEQPASSSQPFDCCERVDPKGPCGGSKGSRSKCFDVELCHVQRTGADQVVPSVCEQG